jgi:hypothetical protein
MKIVLSILGLSLFACVHAQWNLSTIDDFMKQIQLSESVTSSKGSYSYSSKYSFYESFTEEKAKLQYDGILISDNAENLYMEQYGQIVVQNREMNIIIDSSFKHVVIQKAIPGYFKHKTSEEFSMLSNSDCVVKRSIGNKFKKYSLEFAPGGKYMGCELWFNEKEYLIKYILYAGQTVENGEDFYNSELIQPKLEIEFSNFKFGSQVNLDELKKIKDFIVVTKDEIKPVALFSEYEIKDLRIENN